MHKLTARLVIFNYFALYLPGRQSSFFFSVLLRGEVNPEVWDWNAANHGCLGDVLFSRKMSHKLIPKEVVVNPFIGIDPSLLAPEYFSIEVFRLLQIIRGHS